MKTDKKKFRLKIIIGIIVVMLIAIGSFAIYNYHEFSDMKGEYESVESNSLYSLKVSDFGKFSIVDVGAGNPCIKGYLLKIPSKDACFACCLFDSDFDGSFLNIDSKFKRLGYFPMLAGREMGDSYMIVVFENGDDSIQFNEINWLHSDRTVWE